jgi:hypothetical protein
LFQVSGCVFQTTKVGNTFFRQIDESRNIHCETKQKSVFLVRFKAVIRTINVRESRNVIIKQRYAWTMSSDVLQIAHQLLFGLWLEV